MEIIHRSNSLVIGSGMAGLSFALRMSDFGTVTVITKKDRKESNTNYAQGGIAAVMDPGDDTEHHLQDTLVAGAGICHRDAVELLVNEGPKQIRRLESIGARFDADPEGHLKLGREGGHHLNRIVHFADRTGWEAERALLEAVKNKPNITVHEHYFALDLITDSNGDCVGVMALNRLSEEVEYFIANTTLLATGGAGMIYPQTTNPTIATGDGVAQAWRAGARVANLEFMQFHPTTLFHPDARAFLISEAVRGDGAILRLPDGTAFMSEYHEMKDLAPRDVVARAIDAETKKHGIPCVYLDITHRSADYLHERFPGISEKLATVGLDLAKDMIPVLPAAHYMCGGVVTDLNGCTSIRRLLAAGEVSCTGVHGANRLASNSLLEALVYGYQAAEYASHHASSVPDAVTLPKHPSVNTSADRGSIREQMHAIMRKDVGIIRNLPSLEKANTSLQQLLKQSQLMTSEAVRAGLWEDANLVLVASLMVRCALKRHESRGLHQLIEFPNTDDVNFGGDTILVGEERA